MRVLVQRSDKASVSVSGDVKGQIDSGLVLFVGFCEGDAMDKISYLAKRVVNLRIFPDENGVMNQSILEYGGSILSISQFTLYADTTKGNRPSYKKALRSEESSQLYTLFNQELRKYISVEEGVFGAAMEVHITNMGPTTILLER